MLWFELTVILALTVCNGVFASAEIAMLSVRKTRLQELADAGSSAARAALQLRRTPETLLATIQIGITVIGASTAVFGGAQLEDPLEAFFVRLGMGTAAGGMAIACVVVLVSYLSLVIGELVPKSLALRSPERVALAVARPLVGLAAVSRPLVWLLTISSNVVLRPFRDRTTFSESRLSPDELQQLLEESAVAGALHPAVGEIASRAIDLARLKAVALMVPVASIATLRADATEDEVLQVLRRSPHARYPVHGAQPRDVIGYVIARDVYDAIVRKRLALRKLVRPILRFPLMTPAIEVLRALQSEKHQLALLTDDSGELAGLITIEDVAEDVLGDILEEHEVPRVLVWRDDDGAAVIALGEAPVHEVVRALDEDLPYDAPATTLAGLLAHLGIAVTEVGQRFTLAPHIEAEVVEVGHASETMKLRLRGRGDEHADLR